MRLRYFEGEILIGAASGSMLRELRNVDFFMLLDDVFMDFLDGEEREEESFRYMGCLVNGGKHLKTVLWKNNGSRCERA